MIIFAKGSKRLIQGIIGNLIRNKWSHNELIVGSNSLVDYYSFVTEDDLKSSSYNTQRLFCQQ